MLHVLAIGLWILAIFLAGRTGKIGAFALLFCIPFFANILGMDLQTFKSFGIIEMIFGCGIFLASFFEGKYQSILDACTASLISGFLIILI